MLQAILSHQSRFKRVIFKCLLPLQLILSPLSNAAIYTEGYHAYFTKSESEWLQLTHLIDPKKRVSEEEDPYLKASQVLFLGDGFERRFRSLADELVDSEIGDARIFRTDIACPKDLDLGRVRHRRVDHAEAMPFPDDQFDVIVLRHGLCHCRCTQHSCGGIGNEIRAMTHFLSEVTRVLNKRNPSAIAYLHGDYFKFCEHEMGHLLKHWEIAISEVKKLFPMVQVTLVHQIVSPCECCVEKLIRHGKKEFKSKFSGIRITLY